MSATLDLSKQDGTRQQTISRMIEMEIKVKALWLDGEIPFLTHLCGGNEEQLAKIFESIKPTDWVFSSHRAHYHYLLHGGNDLVSKVLAGKSMFLFGDKFICSAIVAGTACIAAGVALSIKRRGGQERVYCFIGDGGSEEGHFFEAVKFVHDRDLPCTFIIEDNNSSCGVTKEQRHSKPWNWPSCVIRYEYTATYPHAGTSERPTLKWKP